MFLPLRLMALPTSPPSPAALYMLMNGRVFSIVHVYPSSRMYPSLSYDLSPSMRTLSPACADGWQSMSACGSWLRPPLPLPPS